MSELPRRERVHACIHPDTYKYFLPKDRVFEIWALLQQRYGPRRVNEGFRTQDVEGSVLLFRSTWLGNPITVYRKLRCTEGDIDELHELIGFQG